MKVVITSIFAPTDAVRGFASQYPGDVIVVGDAKTPEDWECAGVQYLAPDARGLGKFSEVAPLNHYSRKNIGYIEAMAGVDVIAESDDDNIPFTNWGPPPFTGEYLVYDGRDPIILNQYSWFTNARIWPRGLPLDRVLDSFSDITDEELTRREVRVGVWQALANGEPDVDAVYRLTSNATCDFDERDPVVVAGPAMAPTNSQNTFWARPLFGAMYLPSTVTFRYTDILRGFIANIIANELGYGVGFCEASVRQDRNPHDYMRDFASETPMYLGWDVAVDAARRAVRGCSSVVEAMRAVYAELVRSEVVTENELVLLESWLADVERVGT